MTHQEALNCVYRLSELKMRIGCFLNPAERAIEPTPAEGSVIVYCDERRLDAIIEVREKIRALGYDADLSGYSLEITGPYHTETTMKAAA